MIEVMEFTAVVLHRGALAYYAVSERGRDRFVASLVAYKGDPASSPPTEVDLEKQGRHCTGNVEDVALLEELYYAAKEKLKDQP